MRTSTLSLPSFDLFKRAQWLPLRTLSTRERKTFVGLFPLSPRQKKYSGATGNTIVPN